MTKSTHTDEYRSLLTGLRKFREEAGLTQRALATRLKVPPSWVAKIESGERRIDLVEFYWFVKACGEDPRVACDQLLRRFVAPARAGKRGR